MILVIKHNLEKEYVHGHDEKSRHDVVELEWLLLMILSKCHGVALDLLHLANGLRWVKSPSPI